MFSLVVIQIHHRLRSYRPIVKKKCLEYVKSLSLLEICTTNKAAFDLTILKSTDMIKNKWAARDYSSTPDSCVPSISPSELVLLPSATVITPSYGLSVASLVPAAPSDVSYEGAPMQRQQRSVPAIAPVRFSGQIMSDQTTQEQI